MGFRFNKRIKILPGVSINLGKRGISTSIGPRGAKVTIGPKGVRTTVGLPGTGISYTKYRSYKQQSPSAREGIIPVCPRCGHRMRKYWDRCPACGFPLHEAPIEAAPPRETTITCPHCGETWTATSRLRYCPSCGHPLTPEQPTAPDAPAQPAPAPTPATSSKTGTWAALFVLLIILGALIACL